MLYLDKRWENAALLTLLFCLVDWFVFYPVGAHQYFRWSRVLRPVLLVSKVPDLRR